MTTKHQKLHTVVNGQEDSDMVKEVWYLKMEQVTSDSGNQASLMVLAGLSWRMGSSMRVYLHQEEPMVVANHLTWKVISMQENLHSIENMVSVKLKAPKVIITRGLFLKANTVVLGPKNGKMVQFMKDNGNRINSMVLDITWWEIEVNFTQETTNIT